MVHLAGDVRRSIIVNSGVRIAKRDGLAAVSWDTVADECQVKTSRHTVRHHFKHRNDLWAAIVAADPSLKEQGVMLGVVER